MFIFGVLAPTGAQLVSMFLYLFVFLASGFCAVIVCRDVSCMYVALIIQKFSPPLHKQDQKDFINLPFYREKWSVKKVR